MSVSIEGKCVTISADKDSEGRDLGYGFCFKVHRGARDFKARFHGFPDFDPGYRLST